MELLAALLLVIVIILLFMLLKKVDALSAKLVSLEKSLDSKNSGDVTATADKPKQEPTRPPAE